ncbi:MAG: protein-L-isoaspartate O-methyltransferase, partial [Bacteroidales bacterium]|nr:protein-L-isoaspartate O-methyltransferase [Bacteroidales bacterium]
MPTENYLLLGQKKRLIEQLRAKGITDENVLNAFDKMERHRFLESLLWSQAYEDVALKLTTDQTISKPSTVAFQSQLLEVKKGQKVLEIGTGSGFQAAILYAM